jgi:hypothetical protein
LFCAEDDNVTTVSDVERFAAEVKKNNSDVTFVRSPSGGHYRPMILQGIPEAIKWFNALPVSARSPPHGDRPDR